MMLLVSTSASAQNAQQNEVMDTAAVAAKVKAEKQVAPKKAESQTPLKGDVNEDGKVDVADIAAIIAIMKANGGVEECCYYWYVGTTIPTDPSDVSQNTGLNQWTNLGTRLPDSSIKVAKSDTNYKLHTWYIAAPSDANFILYNATNVASDEATWNKSTFYVGTVPYTLWTSKEPGWQAVEYLHK